MPKQKQPAIDPNEIPGGANGPSRDETQADILAFYLPATSNVAEALLRKSFTELTDKAGKGNATALADIRQQIHTKVKKRLSDVPSLLQFQFQFDDLIKDRLKMIRDEFTPAAKQAGLDEASAQQYAWLCITDSCRRDVSKKERTTRKDKIFELKKNLSDIVINAGFELDSDEANDLANLAKRVRHDTQHFHATLEKARTPQSRIKANDTYWKTMRSYLTEAEDIGLDKNAAADFIISAVKIASKEHENSLDRV